MKIGSSAWVWSRTISPWSRFPAAPIPENIRTLRLNAGLGYRRGEKWAFSALLSPSLYRLEDVRGDVSESPAACSQDMRRTHR